MPLRVVSIVAVRDNIETLEDTDMLLESMCTRFFFFLGAAWKGKT